MCVVPRTNKRHILIAPPQSVNVHNIHVHVHIPCIAVNFAKELYMSAIEYDSVLILIVMNVG